MFDPTKLKFPEFYVVWDTETTGLDTQTAEVVELAAKRHAKDGSVETKSWLMKVTVPIPEKITEITGITQELVDREGRDPLECWTEFIDFIGKYPGIGHNVLRYDIPLIQKYKRSPTDFNMLTGYPVDTAALYKAMKMKETQVWYEGHKTFAERILDTRVPGLKYKLEIACAELGIDVSDLTAHRAAADVEMADRLYRTMVGL